MSEPRQGERDAAVVVVVGDAPLADRLRRAITPPQNEAGPAESQRQPPRRLIAVPHYLAVLGEMSRRPVSTVIGRLEPLRSSMEATVRAMRTLAPRANLLLIAEAEQEPEAMRAVRLGFNDYLVQPMSLAQLIEHVTGQPMPPQTAASDAEGQPATIETTGVAEAADSLAAGAMHQSADDSLPGAQQHDDGSTLHDPLRTLEQMPTLAEPGLDGEAGDMVLVEQLLRDRRGLHRAAMEQLRRRLDDPHLRLVREPTEAAACVAVGNEAEGLGYLVSEQTLEEELLRHAAWLARWLRLGRHVGQLHAMAMRDRLTDVWNRRYFEQALQALVDRARAERFQVTLMVFDIDNFKTYNDRYGHAAGDEILSEAAKLMQSVVRQQDVVARIGGDEFAVIFWDAEAPRREPPPADADAAAGSRGRDYHPHSVRRAAARFQMAVCEHRFPKLAEQAPGTLTISGGLASFPWDGRTPQQLLELADAMLMESKQQGKNAITFGPGALRVCGMGGSMTEREGQ